MKLNKLVVAVALTLAVGVAHAKDDDDKDKYGGDTTVNNTNTLTGGSNTNTNNATGGNANNNNSNVANGGNSSATGGSATAQGGKGGRGGNATTGNNSNSTNVTVEGDSYDAPVSSAYAPTVQVGGADQCRITYSGGTQTSALGISFGSSVVDENCERLKLAREVAVTLGDKEVAKQILCQDERVAEAYKAVGKDCAVAVEVREVTKQSVNNNPTAFGAN